MATIAADAGVGIGTLYRHFPSREDLLDYLTHVSFEQVLANAQAAERGATTAAEALRAPSVSHPGTHRSRAALDAEEPRARDNVHSDHGDVIL
jgi:AcrR family transcriptional regulator